MSTQCTALINIGWTTMQRYRQYMMNQRSRQMKPNSRQQQLIISNDNNNSIG
jgi:hypothetical protein